MFKKINILIFLLIISWIFTVNAGLSICDGGDDLDINCEGGSTLSTLEGVDGFSGNYQSLQLGFWGNNYQEKLEKEQEYNIPVGFFGNAFNSTKEEIKTDHNTPVGFLGTNFSNTKHSREPLHITPVGFFGTYIGENIIFKTTYDDEPPRGGGASENTCSPAQVPQNISAEIKNNGFTDYVDISWDKGDNVKKTEIVIVSPQYKKIELDPDVNSYQNFDIVSGKKYSYFVVSYGDCNGGAYSDLIHLEYTKNNGEPSLGYTNGSIGLYNTSSLGEGKLHLVCSQLGINFIDSVIDTPYTRKVDEKYLKSGFQCYGEYFDADGEMKTTEVYRYNAENISYLTNLQALEILLGNKMTDESVFQEFYFMFPDLKADEKLNYFTLSVFLSKIYGDTIIFDKNLSLKLYKELGIFHTDLAGKTSVPYSIFINILNLVSARDNFPQDISTNIDNVFQLNTKKIVDELSIIYNMNEALDILKKTKYQDYEDLKSCLELTGCTNKNLYLKHKNKDGKLYNVLEAGINMKQENSVTYNIYFDLLLRLYISNELRDYKYTKQEIDSFINILLQSITYNDPESIKPVGFMSYNRMKLMLVDNNVQNNLAKLLKYLPEINNVYDKLNDKSKLLTVLREFLMR